VGVDLGAHVGACTRYDVVAGAPLTLVEATIRDEHGTLLTSGDGAFGATLFACAQGKATVELETRGRPGPYALLARAERWKDPAFAAHPLAAARMLARAAVGPGRLFEGVPTMARGVGLDASKLITWDVTLAPSQCAIAAVGVEGAGTGIELRLYDAASNIELDRSHADHAAAAHACAAPSAPRYVRAELRATSGTLDAVIGVRVR
jgi:hypothetical protein